MLKFEDIPALVGQLYSLDEFRKLENKQGVAFFCTWTKKSNLQFNFDQPNWRPIWAKQVLYYENSNT
jgi:hypothetical protein